MDNLYVRRQYIHNRIRHVTFRLSSKRYYWFPTFIIKLIVVFQNSNFIRAREKKVIRKVFFFLFGILLKHARKFEINFSHTVIKVDTPGDTRPKSEWNSTRNRNDHRENQNTRVWNDSRSKNQWDRSLIYFAIKIAYIRVYYIFVFRHCAVSTWYAYFVWKSKKTKYVNINI